jgi:hypothetical protein
MVLTIYKEEEPIQEKELPKNMMPVIDWIKEFADAGFTGTFVAESYEGVVYKGTLEQDEEKVVVHSKRVKSKDEMMKSLYKLLKDID